MFRNQPIGLRVTLLLAAVVVWAIAETPAQAQDAISRTYLAAIRAIQAKQWSRAETSLKSVISRRPQPGPEIPINGLGARGPKYIPLFYLGQVYLEQNRYSDAANALDAVYADRAYRALLDERLTTELKQLRDDARRQDLDALDARVVRLSVVPADLPPTVGAGVIIGGRAQELDIAVPLHVLTGVPDATDGTEIRAIRKPRSITVTFHGAKETTAVTWDGKFNELLDLTAITVKQPPGFAIKVQEYHDTAPKPKDPVMSLGHYPKPWSTMLHTVLNPDEEIDPGKFTITPQGLQPGASGGLVLDARGHLLGMMLKLTENSVTVVGAREIQGLARAWGPTAEYLKQIDADTDLSR